jgi:proteasome accessory factor B
LDKLERLLNLITALLETTRPLTSDELRARVPGYPENKASFRRAFERDKDDLREMGIPLLLELILGVDPPTEGYRIDRARYYLEDPGFEPDELAALHLALRAVSLEGLDAGDGLWKLGGVVGAADGGAEDEPALASLPGDANLASLFQACAERRTVTFAYRDRPRRLDPHRVGYQRGHWYLRGHDHDAGEVRSYRLDRIEGAVEAGPPEAFASPSVPSAGVPDDPWRMGSGPEEVASLLVDADQVAWASRELGDGAEREPRPDGSAVFHVTLTNWPAFRSFVLGFLDHAELLAPADRRSELEEWLDELSTQGAG